MNLLAASALMVAVLAAPALAAGDPAVGAIVFKKCIACNSVGEDAKNKVGPQLNDLLGRTAGTAADYKYSKAMIEAGANGLVWTPETLVPYLRKPKDVVPGTKMSFAGLASEEDELNVIAYLATFSPNYVPPAQ